MVPERSAAVSKYLLNKFLYTIDRDPELVDRYKRHPAETVDWWEAERANELLNCTYAERTTWLRFTDDEREALRTHDHVRLFGLGAHPFLTLTLFIGLFADDHEPLEYVRTYAEMMSHIPMPYPNIAT